MFRVCVWLGLVGAISGCPKNPYAAAEKAAAAGDQARAAQLYVELAKRDPADLIAWDRAIEIQCRQRIDVGACMGILELELDLLGSLQRHHDALAEVLERRARERLAKGMAQAALDDLARATRAAPSRASILAVTAKAQAALGRADEAHATLLRARQLDPANEEANALFAELPKPSEERFGGPERTKSASTP